jgi:hypothetical protein
MAREYDPRSNIVKMRTLKKVRRIAGRPVDIWHAKCLEDSHISTGDTEAEAVLHFNSHLNTKHPGKTIKKV